jgi:hypothetical protein
MLAASSIADWNETVLYAFVNFFYYLIDLIALTIIFFALSCASWINSLFCSDIPLRIFLICSLSIMSAMKASSN